MLFKRHLIALIRCGRKRQTIRLWEALRVRAGQVSYTPGLGRMRITKVDVVASLEALTVEDAVADGFDSRAALLGEIEKIYGKRIPAGRRIYRIAFEWPIDAAGEKLVTGAAGSAVGRVAVRVARKTGVVAKAGARAKQMTAGQRAAVRAFVMEKAPRVRK